MTLHLGLFKLPKNKNAPQMINRHGLHGARLKAKRPPAGVSPNLINRTHKGFERE